MFMRSEMNCLYQVLARRVGEEVRDSIVSDKLVGWMYRDKNRRSIQTIQLNISEYLQLCCNKLTKNGVEDETLKSH